MTDRLLRQQLRQNESQLRHNQRRLSNQRLRLFQSLHLEIHQ